MYYVLKIYQLIIIIIEQIGGTMFPLPKMSAVGILTHWGRSWASVTQTAKYTMHATSDKYSCNNWPHVSGSESAMNATDATLDKLDE